MKKTIGLLVLCAVSALWAQDKPAGTEKAVAALEEKWLAAQKASNPEMLAPLLADAFVDTGSDGKVTGKAETLAATKATKWESAGYDSLKVTVFGNTAIRDGSLYWQGYR